MLRNNRDYVALRDMEQACGKKFFVHLSGQTLGAHNDWVSKFKRIGHSEVRSPQESDYILLFCPIVSRVGTDISEALENAPGGRKILIVMHHTFDPNYTIADSTGLVENRDVLLVVDSLFHEGHLLKSDFNNFAWIEIQRALGVSTEVQVPFLSSIINWVKKNPQNVWGICSGICIGICIGVKKNPWFLGDICIGICIGIYIGVKKNPWILGGICAGTAVARALASVFS